MVTSNSLSAASSTWRSQATGLLFGGFGAAADQAALELFEAWRRDEHVHHFEVELGGALLDAAGTLQVGFRIVGTPAARCSSTGLSNVP